MNEAGMADCGDVGEWLGVDSGKRTQVSMPCMHAEHTTKENVWNCSRTSWVQRLALCSQEHNDEFAFM